MEVNIFIILQKREVNIFIILQKKLGKYLYNIAKMELHVHILIILQKREVISL